MNPFLGLPDRCEGGTSRGTLSEEKHKETGKEDGCHHIVHPDATAKVAPAPRDGGGAGTGVPEEEGRGGGQDSRRRRSALHFVHVERVWRLCVSACIPPPTVCFCKHTYAITFRCCKHTLSSSWCTSRPSRRPRLSSPALASAPGNQTQLG
jgi:hypothetical protein